ncbi:hypothetical protein Tco_0811139 [Tanacetum coccineum]
MKLIPSLCTTGLIDHGLQLHVTSTNQLTAYTNVDLGTLSRSSAEAEYRGVTNVFAEIAWHQHTKHIEIDIYFVCDFVASGQVRVLHVPSHV